ncbi:MAG: RHS repeat-associated core domain-containing protein, partial [Planctomycetes bacterium]|nr:RHS repeat-associated core domain-containing protein [Planctomycetota bacterium]
TGTSWITPSYDRNGNMVVVPRPDDLANGYTCTFDAWNRLVKVEAGISTVATYAYDGLHRRVTKTIDSTVRHFYYTSRWQAIEERLDSSTSPDRHFIWGPLYIDHLILRDRDTSDPPNGTLDERLYALQDANWNVTCLADTAGEPDERYIYDAYGTVTIYDTTWSSTRTSSSYDNTILYGGREYDPETGLFYYRNRYYDSQLGTFVSRDPIFLRAVHLGLYGPLEGRGDTGWYVYVHNSPVNHTDPTGEAAEPNTPEDKAKCCRDARKQLVDYKAQNPKVRIPNGIMICCNGEIITCNWFDENHPTIANDPRVAKAHDVIVMCINAHEMSHLADADRRDWEKHCPCKGVGWIEPASEEVQKLTECNAWLRQIQCLKEATGITSDGLKPGDYAAFCGADNVHCQELLWIIMKGACTKATGFCGRPVPAPPKK